MERVDQTTMAEVAVAAVAMVMDLGLELVEGVGIALQHHGLLQG